MYELHFGETGNTELFPVLPREININVDSKSQSIEIVNLGEVTVQKKPKLATFSLDLELPSQERKNLSTYGNFKKPKFYIKMIEDIVANKKICEFKLLRNLDNIAYFDTKYKCTIESYSVLEKGGNVGDQYLKLDLKEYREAKITKEKLVMLSKDKGIKEKIRPVTKEEVKTYVVQSGDTLWAIAKTILNDGSRYNEIATLNNINNPNLIKVGQVLNLPSRQEVN